jgi:hypothetical protein
MIPAIHFYGLKELKSISIISKALLERSVSYAIGNS